MTHPITVGASDRVDAAAGHAGTPSAHPAAAAPRDDDGSDGSDMEDDVAVPPSASAHSDAPSPVDDDTGPAPESAVEGATPADEAICGDGSDDVDMESDDNPDTPPAPPGDTGPLASHVGAGVGAAVGDWIGTGVGDGSTTVGDGSGTAIGDGTGPGVGDGSSTVVGDGIGTGVGDGISTDVGALVATAVGAGVGAARCRPWDRSVVAGGEAAALRRRRLSRRTAAVTQLRSGETLFLPSTIHQPAPYFLFFDTVPHRIAFNFPCRLLRSCVVTGTQLFSPGSSASLHIPIFVRPRVHHDPAVAKVGGDDEIDVIGG